MPKPLVQSTGRRKEAVARVRLRPSEGEGEGVITINKRPFAEYFPSATHFGLVMGEHTWPEVAQSVLGWLEERRHAMAAAALPVGARR